MEIIDDNKNYQQPTNQNNTELYNQVSHEVLPHSNRMVWSILATIFCCLVGGVVAIVYSAQSNSYYTQYLAATDSATKRNLYTESERQNRKAKNWLIVSFVFGVIVVLLYLILIILGIAVNR